MEHETAFIVPELLSWFESRRQFYELIHTAIAITFPLSNEPIHRRSLSEIQVKVLRAALSNESIWLYDMYLWDDLPRRGLPARREEVAAFLDS